jgi:Domain of unknown function (DUF5615)
LSRPRFLADQDLNAQIIAGELRREPIIEFVRARDVGLGGRPDSEVLEYASAQGLIVVSHDVNTMPAHAFARPAAGRGLAGLLMVAPTNPVGSAIDDIVLIWAGSEAEEWTDQVRSLPL